jgi:chemotaxis protein CheY-P-specific phosphatase CheC
MTDEMLSQEQIDALSSGATLGDIGGSEPAAGDSDDLSGVNSATGILSEQATTVLSTVLSKEVNVSAASAEPAASEQIKTAYAKDYLAVKIAFNKGFQGPFFFVISKKDTAALADLMRSANFSIR